MVPLPQVGRIVEERRETTGIIPLSVGIGKEAVLHVVELVMGTHRNGVVTFIDGQVVLNSPDVLINKVDTSLIARTDIDGVGALGLLTGCHVVFTSIRDVKRRSLIGHVTMVAYEVTADTQFVVILIAQVRCQLGHKGVGTVANLV